MRGQQQRLPQVSERRYSPVEEAYLHKESALRRVFSSMHEAEQHLLELQAEAMELERGTAMRDLHEMQRWTRDALVRDRAALEGIQTELKALRVQQTRIDREKEIRLTREWADALVLGRAGYPVMGDGKGAVSQLNHAIQGCSAFVASMCLGNCLQYRYKDARQQDFEPASDGIENGTDHRGQVEKSMMRRECRGLILGAAGVVARPLQRFFSAGQLTEGQRSQIESMIVAEVTEKLDGTMVFGVVTAGGTELWTKAGFTEPARAATRFAAEGCDDYLGLLAAVEAQNCTATFEWIGKQSLVKVPVQESNLVLLQVRDKVSGSYWGWGQRAALARQFGVPAVMPMGSLEGKTFREVVTAVKEWEGCEGVVVRLFDGCMLKIKTKWWLHTTAHSYRRWIHNEHREQELAKWARRQANQQSLQLRALFVGQLGSSSPAVLLQRYDGATKIEVFYDRDTGRKGATIISFNEQSQRKAALEAEDSSLIPAYSVRSRGTGQKRVMTWNSC